MANTLPYEKITEALIAALQEGRVPWHKPWAGNNGPFNAFSKHVYRGINPIILSLSAYTDPRWATFKQIAEHGGNVKGQHSTSIVFWNFPKKIDPKTGEERVVPYLKLINVFNVEQTTGLSLPPLAEDVRVHRPIEAAEAIVAGYADKPKISHGGDKAYYSPTFDRIGMPHKSNFDSPEHYYSTLFHELAHSTGHQIRLNRPEIVNGYTGVADYSKEELVAEFAACYLCNEARIANEHTDKNSKAYLQGWISKLQGDVRLAVLAASRAQKATDYILSSNRVESEETAEAEEGLIAA